MINLTSLERKAKETLEFISNNDQSFSWNAFENDYEPKSLELKGKKMREGVPSENRHKIRISTADFTGKNIKNLIVPRVITFEQCPNSMREMVTKSVHRREPKKKHSLYSNRTLCSIESTAIDQEFGGVDFMKFWVRHRFEEKSIDSLVCRIESKRRKLREMRG
jgi:hypothetical protein